jgi:queuine tRNA-ribosyltransferase catalytic subunit
VYGDLRLLSPEHSISLQNSIGSDIIMQLDDVIATTSPDLERLKEAMHRSVRWLDRCIAAHKNPESQNLFCIIQGGLDLDMRRECCNEMVKRDTPGIAIGGLSGGEAKDAYCKVYDHLNSNLQADSANHIAESVPAQVYSQTTNPDT